MASSGELSLGVVQGGGGGGSPQREVDDNEEEFLMMLLGAGECGGIIAEDKRDESAITKCNAGDSGLNDDTTTTTTKQAEDLASLQSEVTLLDAELQAMCLEEELLLADEEAFHSRNLRATLRSQALLGDQECLESARRVVLTNRLAELHKRGLLQRMYDVQVDHAIGIINGVRIGRLSPTFFAPVGPQPTTSLSRQNLNGMNPSSGDYATVMNILSKPVSNEEINVGCGYLIELVLLLATISKVHLCQNVVLIPAGSTSTIELYPPIGKKGKKETFDLFINTKFFAWKTFGPAWVILAACVQDIVNSYERKALKLKQRVLDLRQREERRGCALPAIVVPTLPALPVQRDLVGGYSIKHNATSDENWTTAVRHLLTLVQWCVMIEDLSAETELMASL